MPGKSKRQEVNDRAVAEGARKLDFAKLSAKQRAAIEENLEYEWLGLGEVSKIRTRNPLLDRTEDDIQNPHKHLLRIICNPDWFGWTCQNILNMTVPPFQLVFLRELWHRAFPMLLASRGASKSSTLGLYSVLRALICQGSRVVIIGSAFRQAKGVLEYAERIWNNAPVLRDLVGPGPRKNANGLHRETDRWYLKIGESTISALPMGTGEKLRGTRATHLIVDEYASINPQIFDVVVRGFGSVSASPVERMQKFARFRRMKEYGFVDPSEIIRTSSNQTVIVGTAYYTFNHFYKDWKKYKAIVESRGDRRRLEEIFNGKIPDGFDHRDFCVIRLPLELIPEGFMDEKTIGAAKATMHEGNYSLEYSVVFSGDSNGFFKRSLIESCVTSPDTPLMLPSGPVSFGVSLFGRTGCRYAMGVDPASESDNFAIVLVELHPDHRRIVHCWTINKASYQARADAKLTSEKDFYYYAARKIRELNYLFPCDVIAIDKMGGGISILEALKNTDALTVEEKARGDVAILPVIDPDDPQPTDGLPGLHIIQVIKFANSDWLNEANHGMKMDFESKALLFPYFDQAGLGVALEEDTLAGRVPGEARPHQRSLYDSLEGCMLEIEELKDELATIVHSQTSIAGREHWDTPEIKLPGNKKGRLRKDRYSALLMANAEGRKIGKGLPAMNWEIQGVVAGRQGKQSGRPAYEGALWLGEAACEDFGVVRRR